MKRNEAKYWGMASRVMVGVALLAASALAQAQYVWVDEKGIKQFSDQPPPASVPLKRILKAPGELKKAIEDQAAKDQGEEGDAAATPAAKSKAPATLADRNADFNKRKIEAAEKEKKASEEAQRKASNASACEQMRKAQAAYDSGVRISNVDKNGERNYMSDEERAATSARNKSAMAKCE